MNKKIGFIGCGNMAEGLIKGLLFKNIAGRRKILASDISSSRIRYIKNKYKINTTHSNSLVAKRSDVIMLAIKPQNMDKAICSIYDDITYDKLIISIAAGIRTKYLKDNLPRCKIIRVMPNTPALVGCGITAICRTKSATSKDFELAKRIFASVGEVVEVDEKFIGVVTATSGSGPAYFFLLIDAIAKAAVSLSLDGKTARKLVLNTAYGAAALAIKTQKDMGRLIKSVASKGGTTEAALEVFKRHNFNNIVRNAVNAAVKKAKELAK